MKITTFLLFMVCMQVSAIGLAQKVTLIKKNVTLKEVFKEINKQTGYNIFGSDDNELSKKIDADFKDVAVLDVLEKCLENTSLTYSTNDHTIVIKKKENSLIDNIKDKVAKFFSGPADIYGTLTDSTGTSLPGASVSLKGTAFTTTTDGKGNFGFTKVPEGNYTLVVTYVGYTRLEKTIEVANSNLNIHLTIYRATSALDLVEVIAYGTDTKRFSVGAVSTITADDIAKQPVSNVLLAMEGKAPGLAVTATSGVPGSNVLIQVRGQNTLSSNPSGFSPYDQPLFVIDGVPFAPQNGVVSQLSSLAISGSFSGGISQAGGIGAFNEINPDDIESISILKDADATSIYGTQGSNGVILITTKKGKPGRDNFSLDVNTGFNSDARPITLLNTQQYLQLRKDAFAVDGVTPSNDPNNYLGYAPDLTIFDQNRFTNWQKVIFGNTSSNTNVHGQLSGGTINNTYLVSAGYTNSAYNLPGNDGYADQRWTMHNSYDHTSTDKKFTLNFVTDIGYDKNNSPGFGASKEILLPPNLPALLDGQGNLLWNYKGVDLSNYQFYSYLKTPVDLQGFNLNSSLRLQYKILQNLSFSVNLGYSRNSTTEHSEDPDAAQNPSNASASAEFANNLYQTINIEPQLNFTQKIGKGVFSALLGSTYKKNTNNSNTIQGSNYSNDYLLGSIDGAGSVIVNDNSSIYRYNAGFARLKYIYDQKYIIEFTGRRDGSSNFGPGHQFGNFGSAAAGWIFSQESAIKNLPFVSYGKLSGSYGTSGSDGIQPYNFQNFYQALGPGVSFQGITSDFPVNLYNPVYSWALKKSLNLALDLGFFNDRLLLNATYYRQREGNQLVQYPLPIQTGFTGVLGNLNAEVQNQGWEFSITSTNIKTKNFTWNTNFNVSFNRNKLLAFPNLALSSYSSVYVIGQPTSLIYGFKYKDVNPTTGLFEFYDKNGGVTSNPVYGTASTGGDEVPIANGEVNYLGGFGNTFSYKRFSFYVFCQFSSQMAPNYLSTVYSSEFPGMMNNEPIQILNNYWQKPGDHAMLQRLTSSFSSPAVGPALAFAQSSGAYSNDTYLRVKTISLSYNLPDLLLKKIHIQGASIYVNAQNVFTFSNAKVGDPEQFNDFTSFPIQRVIAFGANLKF